MGESVLTKANIVVGAAVALVAAAAFAACIAFIAGQAAEGGLRALVHDSQGTVHEMPLDQDATLVVTTDKGENTVVVQGGSVSVVQADCDGQDCVHQGSLSAPGGQIICLPHQLWIEVVASDGEAGQMDAAAVQDGDEGVDVLSR